MIIFASLVPDTGGKESKNMSRVRYTSAPPEIGKAMDNATPVEDDILPSPEYFAEKLSKEKNQHIC